MNNDLKIDLHDYETVLRHKGKIIGSCYLTKVATINDDFKNQIGKQVSFAKGILVNFFVSSKISLFVINDIMGMIAEQTNENCEIIFSSEIDNTLNEDEMIVQMILTGL